MEGKPKENFSVEKNLTEEQKLDFDFVQERIEQLKEARKSVKGTDLEAIWRAADKAYVPHRLNSTGKKVEPADEEKGWAGPMTTVGKEADWQVDNSYPNLFVKLQVALSILIDRNPEGVFTPGASRYENTTRLMKQLYQRSWEIARSKQQLKLFIFNLAKYGWAVARTYPLKITRTNKELVKYDEEDPDRSEYRKKEVVEYNEIFRKNLNPWKVWIDDLTTPGNQFSMRDWTWEEDYAYDVAKAEFGNYKRFKYVEPKSIDNDAEGTGQEEQKKYKETKMVKVKFYESITKDLFMVILNDIPVVIEPLPVSDDQGRKKLSCWQAPWLLRDAEVPYGVGIYEAIRYEAGLYDRLNNMTMDQLTLAIYKMFFYSGTETLSETGEMEITPGQGKQVSNPKDISWLEVPGPGAEAWQGLEYQQEKVDKVSGITDPLMGEIVGKTAYETAQAKEAALKRLKNPLENVCDALETEGYITTSLIQMIYSVPETYQIADPKIIAAYLKEIKSDPELYERDEKGTFTAKVYPEVPINLDSDEKGNLIETKDTRFFRIKPKLLGWEGVIHIKPQSILVPSKELNKSMDLEFIDRIIALIPQPPELFLKPAKQLCKIYEKDPDEFLPDSWLEEKETPMIMNRPELEMGQMGQGGEMGQLLGKLGQASPNLPRIGAMGGPNTAIAGNRSLSGRITDRATNFLSKIRPGA